MKKISLFAVLFCEVILAAGCAKETPKVPDLSNMQSDEITGEITVSCFETALSKTFLEEAALQFEQKYPGTKVNINSFSEMPETKSSNQNGERTEVVELNTDSQGRADYISKTSTALMSGQGADLLAMDVLPVYKYVESGQMENLKTYMENDPSFQKADYRENILHALEFQNGVWFLPLNYSFNYYAYDSTLAGGLVQTEFGANQAFTSKQLLNLSKPVIDGTNKIFSAPAYLPSGNGDLFSQLFNENYRSFVDTENNKANFSDGKFKELIQDVKSMAEDGTISTAASQSSGAYDPLKSAQNPTERFMFKPKNQFSLVQQTHPDPEFKMTVATSEVGSGIEDDDQIAGICADDAGIVPFTYDQAFGINSNSTNKKTAWEFLKFLLSYDVQASPNMSFISLPIHNEARMDRTETLYRMLLADAGELNESQQQALKNYLEAVETMSDQINDFILKDTTIQDMVVKEMRYYFDATKTAEQVCQVLQNKVDLYLNE